MRWSCVQIWGDSLLKGVVFDELRSRYAILKENSVSKLASLLSCPVENHARMGCTVTQALELVPEEDAAQSSDTLALIEFGGNDCDLHWAEVAADPYAEHAANTPLDHFSAILAQLVQRVRHAGMRAMLVVPTPLHAPRYFDWVTKGLDKQAVLCFLGDVERIYRWQELYAQTVYHAAVQLNCSVLDLRQPFLARKHYEDLLCIDGIHPNAAGHEVMLETMCAALC